jgi:EAL domain-containing protein (putative c-di-GMP-specific phosphodiesterase class I)
MYESKRQGVGRPVLFTAPLHEAARKSLAEEGALRQALESDLLEMRYHPVIDLASGHNLAYDAQVRWWSGGRHLVAAEFIDLAERSGLILDLGAWILDTVCREGAALRTVAGDEVPVGVEVSPLQIAHPGLADIVERAMGAHDLPATSFVLKLTEHHELSHESAARTNLQELHELGVLIVLKDFGVGWASLDLLRTVPVGGINIAQSFIAEMMRDPVSHRLVEAVLDIGRRFELFVVADGIQTAEQRDRLLELGATVGQGPFFSAGLSPADLLGIYEARSA